MKTTRFVLIRSKNALVQLCSKRRLTRVTLVVLMGLMFSASVRADPLADALDTPGWTWTQLQPGGGGPWTVDTVTTHDGVAAACSGTPPYGLEARLETTLNGPGTVVFWAKASTPGGSYLVAEIRGLTSYYIQNADWRAYTLDVPAGAATLSFRFVNWDLSGSAGDAAWVDQVSFADYTGQAPVIVWSPPNATVGEGDYQSWPANAVGDQPLVVSWEHAGTNRFGFYWVQSSDLSIRLQAGPADAGDWRFVVTNGFGAATSSVSTLTVTSTPPHNVWIYNSFLSYANPVHVGGGANFSLVVSVAGTGPFTYQWRKNGTDLPSQAGQTLAFAGFTAAAEGNYTCVVSNALGAESADLTLVLDGALPVIVNPPQSLSVAPGDGFQLAVAVTGPEPLSYQWFKDSALLPFDTASTLYRWGAAAADTGLYRVRVSNPNGEIWSAPVTVSVGGGVPLGEPVEAPLRAWSTVNGCVGGAAWLGVTNVTHDGVDAAGSVPLSNDQVCTLDLQTEVAGPLTLGFWWKLQGAAADELRVDVRDASLNVVASAARNGADGNGWTNVKPIFYSVCWFLTNFPHGCDSKLNLVVPTRAFFFLDSAG